MSPDQPSSKELRGGLETPAPEFVLDFAGDSAASDAYQFVDVAMDRLIQANRPPTGHPAACPDDVMAKMQEVARRLDLTVNVGAERQDGSSPLYGAPIGRWTRYIEVDDPSLPPPFRKQRENLSDTDSWEAAAKRVGLWARG